MKNKAYDYINQFTRDHYKRYNIIVPKDDTLLIEKLEEYRKKHQLSKFVRLCIRRQIEIDEMK